MAKIFLARNHELENNRVEQTQRRKERKNSEGSGQEKIL